MTTTREQGNQAFKQGNYSEAIDRYTEAINSLLELQLNESNKNDLTKCFSNRSQCYINLNQYEDAIEDATRGREIDKNMLSLLLQQRHFFF